MPFAIRVAEWTAGSACHFLASVRLDPRVAAEDEDDDYVPFEDLMAWLDRVLRQCESAFGRPHWPSRKRSSTGAGLMGRLTGKSAATTPAPSSDRSEFLDLATHIFFRIDAPMPVGCSFGGDAEPERVDLVLSASQLLELICDPASTATVRRLLEHLEDGRIESWQAFESRESMRRVFFGIGSA